MSAFAEILMLVASAASHASKGADKILDLPALMLKPKSVYAAKLGKSEPIRSGVVRYRASKKAVINVYDEGDHPDLLANRVFWAQVDTSEFSHTGWVEALDALGFGHNGKIEAIDGGMLVLSGLRGLPPGWKAFYRESSTLFFAPIKDELKNVTIEHGFMSEICDTMTATELATQKKNGYLRFSDLSPRHRKLFLLTGNMFSTDLDGSVQVRWTGKKNVLILRL